MSNSCIFNIYAKKTPWLMFDRVLNASLVIYRITILRITFVGTFFVLKLQVMCLQRYCKRQFLGIFRKLFRMAIGRLLQISPEILVISCFPCSISFLKVRLHHKFYICFSMKNYLTLLELKDFDFKYMYPMR